MQVLENAQVEDYKIMQILDGDPGSYFIMIPRAARTIKMLW
jgi:hypothetical protein